MTTSRAELATRLEAKLPTYQVVPDPRAIGTLDPGKEAALQIVRDGLKPNPGAPQAQYLERFHLWVITPLKAQPAAEDDLDDRVLEVTDALFTISSVGWEDAQRLTHPEGFHAYRISVTYETTKEQSA